MITLYDLMACDHNIEAKKMDNGQVMLSIFREEPMEDDVTVYQDQFHPYAWESLVYFAKQVLKYDEKITK